MALDGNGQQAANRLRQIWTERILSVVSKGTNGGQPSIAAAHTVGPLLLQMSQERQHALGI